MRIILLTASLLMAFAGYAQKDIRVPYRVGDKFGLSDKDGNIKVKPAYDKIEYIGNGYFHCTWYQIDSIGTSYYAKKRKVARKTPISSVVYKDKVIIADQPYESCYIYKDRFLVASENEFRPEHFKLFNLKGEVLIDEQLKGIDVNDKRDSDRLGSIDTNYMFLSLFHEGSYNQRPFSLAVYDKRTNSISDWLLEKVTNYKFISSNIEEGYIHCSFTDANHYVEKKYIAYNWDKKKFEVVDKLPQNTGAPTLTAQTAQNPAKRNAYAPMWEDFDEMDIEMGVIIEEEPREFSPSKSSSVTSNKSQLGAYPIYFQNSRDTSFLYGGLLTPNLPNSTNIFMQGKGRQLNPIIYKTGDKYGLILSDKEHTKATYDSLTYIQQYHYNGTENEFHYLAGKKNKKGEMKLGIIDQHEKEIVPLEYETIYTYIPEIFYDHKPLQPSFFNLREPSDSPIPVKKKNYLNKNPLMWMKKDGKGGLVDRNYETYLPLEYDAVYKNGIGHMYKIKSHSKFYIVKKDGKYGFVKDINVGKSAIDESIKFPEMPNFYFPDYYDAKGFNLVGLITEEGFFCYAREDGFVYYTK